MVATSIEMTLSPTDQSDCMIIRGNKEVKREKERERERERTKRSIEKRSPTD